jgi:hypothetical protein
MEHVKILFVISLIACASPTNGLQNGNCQFNAETGTCDCIGSPIILDLHGDGIHLTAPGDGVAFALNPGHVRQWSWTLPGTDDAWLVFDRDQNGTIDDGSEMFGDYTQQPESTAPNGFLALAVYDENHDGMVDSADSVWPFLRLWEDRNHDGVSQPDELMTLDSVGVRSISLKYESSKEVDSQGNQYRYSTRVVADSPVAKTAVDVWLRSTKTVGIHPHTLQYKCWGWGYYRNFNSSDICSRVYVLGDPIATDGLGRLSRFVARYAIRTSAQEAVAAATGSVQQAVNVTTACSDPVRCSDYCSPPSFPVPDSFRPAPYWSIYDPDVWQRASCDPAYDDGAGGTSDGGLCQ